MRYRQLWLVLCKLDTGQHAGAPSHTPTHRPGFGGWADATPPEQGQRIAFPLAPQGGHKKGRGLASPLFVCVDLFASDVAKAGAAAGGGSSTSTSLSFKPNQHHPRL
jgi:hypothetical protein